MAAASALAATHNVPLFFWREFEEDSGFLSQWYEAPFTVDDQTYASTEMWMMVQKAKLFGDEEIAQKMLETKVPSEHQKLGRQVKGFNRAKWDEHKSKIVEDGNYHKFTKCDESLDLKAKLLATGTMEMVEASPTDRIWGVGFGREDAEKNRDQWGENRLAAGRLRDWFESSYRRPRPLEISATIVVVGVIVVVIDVVGNVVDIVAQRVRWGVGSKGSVVNVDIADWVWRRIDSVSSSAPEDSTAAGQADPLLNLSIVQGNFMYTMQDLTSRLDLVDNEGKGDSNDYLLKGVQQEGDKLVGQQVTLSIGKPSSPLQMWSMIWGFGIVR